MKRSFGGIANRIPASIKRGFLEHDCQSGNDFPEDTEEILGHLSLADWTAGTKQSGVPDFAKELLKDSGYRSKGRLIMTRDCIPWLVSGHDKFAQTDGCTIRMKRGQEMYLMLLQEDKTLMSGEDAEAQVIAQAIAAFQANNENRMVPPSPLKPLGRMVFPCITMLGAYPKFYLVPVTMGVSDCVSHHIRHCPSDKTVVLRHIPMVPCYEPMKSLGDRKKIIQCFEAFKKFVDNVEQKLNRCFK